MLCDSIENFAKHDSAFIPALRELAPLFEAVKTRSFEEMKKMELGPFRLCFNEYETRPEAEVPFETHEGNWDLQIMVDGAEYMGWAPAADLSPAQPYDEKEAFKLTPQSEARRRKALEKQAAALGLTLQPAAA